MAAGFDMIQSHADLLSGKVHAVPTRSTATAADAAAQAIIRDTCLGPRSRRRATTAPPARASRRWATRGAESAEARG